MEGLSCVEGIWFSCTIAIGLGIIWFCGYMSEGLGLSRMDLWCEVGVGYGGWCTLLRGGYSLLVWVGTDADLDFGFMFWKVVSFTLGFYCMEYGFKEIGGGCKEVSLRIKGSS